jgi:sugar lactone lactonase YvrE
MATVDCAAMQRQLWSSWLVLAIACHPASPPPPAAAAPDPVLIALLAQIDERLVSQPGDGTLLYQRASLMIPVGAKPVDALPFLARLEATGWDIPFADVDFGPLAGDPRYRELAARVAARTPKVARSTVAFSVPGPDLIPEGIAVDDATGTFYLSSMHRRTIVAIDPAGGARRFMPEGQGGILSVLGMKVDRARGVLWAASHAAHSMIGYRAAHEADGAYALSLADGKVVRRVVFADREAHLSNDLAIASDGTVYLTDSASGGLYRIPPDRDALELVVPTGTFGYPNGLALAGDDRLYVADALGIALVSFDSRTVQRLTAPPNVALGGIDGLVLEGNRLLGVQGSLGKPRIVAITVDGDRATGLTVLENSGALDQPTTTCVWQGALYTIANSQIDAIGPDGVRPGRTLADPWIMRTPL